MRRIRHFKLEIIPEWSYPDVFTMKTTVNVNGEKFFNQRAVHVDSFIYEMELYAMEASRVFKGIVENTFPFEEYKKVY